MNSAIKRILALVALLVSIQPAIAQDEPQPLNVYNGEIPEAANVFYVATDGNDDAEGTEAAPWATIPRAISAVSRGDVIVVRGGIYELSQTISIQSPSGFTDQLITLMAYPGEVPILDFASQPRERNRHGLRINANWWHIIGITVRNAAHNGIRMDGSYNILEQVTAYGHHDTGIHMAGGASHNLILNTDSFHNFNYDINRTPRIGNNADGFGAKFSIGPGNRYVGCRAWENSDDGFDFWEAQGTILIENSWAFGNGDASVFGNPANFEGNGNGFKLGGNYVRADHIVRRSMAFDNFGASGNAKGFDYNNNPGAMHIEHNSAYNNARNYWFPLDPPSGQAVFLNNMSAVTNLHAGAPPNAVLAGNSWQITTNLDAGDFVSVDTELAKGPRQEDGSLPDIPLLRPQPESVLVDGGVAFGQPFYGEAPDIGAIELQIGAPVDPWIDAGASPLVAGLRVYDVEAGDQWAIRHDLSVGADAYADSDATVEVLSSGIQVEEWIRTAQATGSKNYLFTAAELTLTESTMVLVAHSDRISAKPSWLSAFEATDASVVLDVGGTTETLTVYRAPVAAGEQVTLGRNASTAQTDVPMYMVMIGHVTMVSADDMPVAATLELHSNYPNPFSSSTTISFSAAHPGSVSLTVHDVMGREVSRILDGYRDGGKHEIVWDAPGLASGVYFLRLTADGRSETRRLVIVR